MWDDNLREQVIQLEAEAEKRQLEDFLAKQDLALDKDVEYAIALFDGVKIAAVGCFGGKVLKCIAVEGEYQNKGLSAGIVTALINEEYRRARTHLFIYTKPQNKLIFSELGFYTIAEIPNKVILMENKSDGIIKYLAEIVGEKITTGNTAAVVVNCDPFTLGHKYLIEYAAAKTKKLHIFVVWEDRSSFPSEIRYKLVREGVQHLPNVEVHKGKDYIISNATFPSYFIKKFQDQVETHARLDLEVFSQYIVPALGIRKRFVGEEPYCKITATYNRIMQEILPAHGVKVEVVPRLTYDRQAISASRVRELIRIGEMDKVRELVPKTTYQFLISAEAEVTINQIRLTSQRH